VQTIKKSLFKHSDPHGLIWVSGVFLISLVFLFYNAFRFSFPLGYAGMYSLMAYQISVNNFRLPLEVPFYGPGGTPFAYPPFALYLMAIFLKMKISIISYLRFAPPVFSFLGLVPLYLFVKDITNSRLAAGLSVVYVAFSPLLYISQTWSAGIVRSLAFLLMLSFLFIANKAILEENLTLGVIAGVFGGLTILTHLFYALFLGLWVFGWFIPNLNRLPWKIYLSIFGVMTLVVSPWLVLVSSRYGLEIYGNIFFSHNNDSFMNIFRQPEIISGLFYSKIAPLSLPISSFVLVNLGVVYVIISRKLDFLLTILLSLFILTNEGTPAFILLEGILYGSGILLIIKAIRNKIWMKSLILMGYAFVNLQIIFYGCQQIMQMSPGLNTSQFDVKNYVQENFPTDVRYLAITERIDAEWFPYLLQREPFLSPWGSEWLGTYGEQVKIQKEVNSCKNQQSVDCLKELNFNIEKNDILIVRRSNKKLLTELKKYSACKKLISVDLYVILGAQCLRQ